ncbi:probable E3 ubiquitin-protein ligase makorin-1 [Drosophila teissieri]|uniref:probable E3 ubiquitin-protein ligase makorin-1 n=1 Tax=Drosophila teissieri TaxID=7243 RepID=UPI001CBA113C|nr:probable E3 ubiquitin-protein ligase makorin-1 [Drosophila teissieri]
MSTVTSSDHQVDADTDVLQMPSTSTWSQQRNWANAAEFVPSHKRAMARAQDELETTPAAAGCSASARGPAGVSWADVVRGPSSSGSHVQPSWSCSIARSQDKKCGICFETIMEKEGGDRRFAILPSCNHVFCFECICTWRKARQFEYKVRHACPECRVWSDFVCPSAFWVEDREEKDQLLNDYRAALGARDCKYFRKGVGRCPFGNQCFYKHALPNGDHVEVGLPMPTQWLPVRPEFLAILRMHFFRVHRPYVFSYNVSSSEYSDYSDNLDED